MKKIWNLLENEALFLSLEEVGYTLSLEGAEACDVLVCGLEHIEYAGAMVNPLECFIIVALENPEMERHLVPSTFNAWIDRSKLERLPAMLQAYQSHIDEKIKFRETHNLLERLVVDTSVHCVNLGEIKLNMRSSTKEIEKIFEERVEEMRAIHHDTTMAHEKLTALKDQIVPKEFNDLQESWEMTQSILTRTNEVIKAMFGFVMVLQCEDRISQMIEGIENIMNDDILNATENGVVLTPETEAKLKERLLPFYTIQEQRDYAMGQSISSQGCQHEQVDIDDFLLF
ncbi:MAG: hypothetical protein NTY39_08930 [Campylobacterales bacterium]|nr:hypothetical protein [Campylobacterales bacterium]